jgi:homoserine kinase type II
MRRFIAIIWITLVQYSLLVSAFRAYPLLFSQSLFHSNQRSMTSVFGGGQFKDLTPTELRYEALDLFLGDSTNFTISPTSGGVNNICDYVTTPDGEKYVLRIYNNGRDSVRVDFEHRVLDALLSSGEKYSFRLPTAIASRVSGHRHVVLSNGAEATLFEFIPGELPKKSRVRAIGRASGELVSALGRVKVDMVSPNPRFCDLFKAHHATTSEIFFAEMKKPQFDISPDTRKYADLLCEEVVDILKQVDYMKTLDLPVQLIHADLHYDNVLVDGEEVSGLLDFEFSVHDWRG